MDTKLREQMERGQRAEIALAELKGAIEALEEDCYRTFSKSGLHDDDGRRACRYYLQVLHDVNQRFELAIKKGEGAQKKLVQLKPSLLKRVANV